MKQKFYFLSIVLGFTLMSSTVWAQTSVSGTVLDATVIPLVGANVLEKGTNNGAQTDFDGNYTLTVADGATLVFSYVGFQTKEVAVTGGQVNVTMEEDAAALDEVVVTGYGSQSKRDLTGAVSTVDAEELLSVPATTFAQQLQGRASGISIVNDATPGGEATVRIRGFGTIGNNDPLYIIDGVPSQSQGTLNPNDIESLQILKDASAASIYGSRAANGVVIITTKRGKLGKPSIRYQTYYGIQTASEDVEVLNASELGTYLYLSDLYAGKTPSHGQYTYGPNGEVTIPDYVFPSGANEGDPGTNPSLYSLVEGNIYAITRSADTYWWDEVTRSAPIKSHNISASGATESAKYAMNLGYFSQDAVTKFVGYDRLSLRVNTEFSTLKDRLTIGENFTVTYGNRKGGFSNNDEQNAVSGSYKHHPLLPIYDIAGNFAGSRGQNLGNNYNPYAYLFRAKDNRTYNLRAFGNAFASYDILEDLEIKTSLGIDYNNRRVRELGRPQPEYVEGNFINSSTARSSYQYQWVWSNVLTWDHTFNDVHKLNVYGGTEAIESFGEEFGASRQRFAFETNPILSYLDLGDATTSSNYGYVIGNTDFSLFSLFGQASYSYDDKYLAQVTIRNDKSSRFLQASQSATFPAFSLGWRMSEESFMDNVDIVNDLKIRYGYGQTGNQLIGDYNPYTTYRSDIFHSGYPIDGSTGAPVIGFDVLSIGNPDAKWETTTSHNAGLDLAMLNNRLSFNLDVYTRKTTDMLFRTPITFTHGDGNAPSFNVGEMTNNGFDIALGWSDVIGDFSYSINGNFSRYVNEVNKLDAGENTRYLGNASRVTSLTLTQAGVPISSFYGYKVEGIFQNQGEVDNWPAFGSYNAPGKFKYADTNGDGIISSDDRTIIGSPHPDFTYGVNIDLRYKNWSLNVFFNGQEGNDIYNYVRYFSDFNTFQGNRSRRALYDAWQPANPEAPRSQWVAANPGATSPIMDANDQQSSQPSSYFIEDGSYFRLKNVQLTFNFPDSLMDTIGISGGQVYLQGQNLITWTKYTGLNPEIQTGTDSTLGFDGGYMPVYRTFTVGLNVDLF